MDWAAFLTFLSTHESRAVMYPALKTARLESFADSECVVEVENLGIKFFLDSKRVIVEDLVRQFCGIAPTMIFTVAPRKVSKKKQEAADAPTLLQFQSGVEEKIRMSGLQPRFTFEHFAVSPSNHMAYAASQAVGKNPGKMYNPLFLYGDVGTGKTHLSQAVANEIVQKDPKKKVLYCTSEQFTNDLVNSIRSKQTQSVRDKYRNLHVLIVDDVQFIAGKNYVQEEFYHTFNAVVQQGGQIVMTSDRPPKEIRELEDRLRSRFSGGLIIDMQKPDFELRTAIVLIKAEERKIDIDMKAAQNIAEKITDTRELEGALLKLLSLSLVSEDGNKITAEAADTQLSKEESLMKARIRPDDVIRAVSIYYDVKPAHIRGTSRKQNIVMARQIAMYILRVKLGLNLDEVAFITKRKDHTTVIHGVGKIEKLVQKDAKLNSEIEEVYHKTLQ